MTVFWILRVSRLSLVLLTVAIPCLATPEVKIEDYRTLRDRVKLLVTVQDEQGETVPHLTQSDFKVLVDKQPIPLEKVTPAQQSPTPTNVIILLDTSGSMESEDSSGVKRKTGAIAAIRQIRDTFRSAPVKVKLIPFGEGGGECQSSNVAQSLEQQTFLPLDDPSWDTTLENLEARDFCRSTDLYNPLIQTLEYLSVERKKESNTNELPPRFAIILLSDGFHSYGRTCSDDTEAQLQPEFRDIARQVPNIPIYTVGYGLSSSQLKALMRREFDDPNPSLKAQSFYCDHETHPKFGQVQEQFIDHESLARISESTNGGEYQTFEQAEQVSATLEKFVRAILGKYELEYVQPSAQPGDTHRVVVQLSAPKGQSKSYPVTFDNWLFQPMPKLQLLSLLTLGVGGAIVWLIVFSQWAKKLKKQSRSRG